MLHLVLVLIIHLLSYCNAVERVISVPAYEAEEVTLLANETVRLELKNDNDTNNFYFWTFEAHSQDNDDFIEFTKIKPKIDSNNENDLKDLSPIQLKKYPIKNHQGW